MEYTFEDSDIKIYKRYSEEDINRYIELYLTEKKCGIRFEPLFLLAHKDLIKKNWLLSELHKGTKLPIDVNEVIDDYSMHLLTVFFILNSSNKMFNYVERNFIDEYVRNESELEGFDDKSPNVKEMRAGLETMYRFLCSPENDSTRGSTMLTDLHEKLYSHVEYGRYAREYRTEPVIHFFGNVDVPEPRQIFRAMLNTDNDFDKLYEEADKIYNSEIEDRMHMINPFLERLMKYSVDVIKIQPFPDGNKRSTRGVINFLLQKAGLPPVYVKVSEEKAYKDALEDAMIRQNYRTITNFYKNKLCDSIEELVIDPFVYAINVYNKQEEIKESKKQKGSNLLRLINQEKKKQK